MKDRWIEESLRRVVEVRSRGGVIHLGFLLCVFVCGLFLPSSCAVAGLYPVRKGCEGKILAAVVEVAVVAEMRRRRKWRFGGWFWREK